MVKLPFLKITWLGAYTYINIKKNFCTKQRRILLAKTYEQQTTQNTYQIVKVLDTSIFGYILEQKEQSVLPV